MSYIARFKCMLKFQIKIYVYASICKESLLNPLSGQVLFAGVIINELLISANIALNECLLD